ncbi:MAG: hypothetical protein ACXVXN_06630, partial [Mycobacteriaceae bacterium]
MADAESLAPGDALADTALSAGAIALPPPELQPSRPAKARAVRETVNFRSDITQPAYGSVVDPGGR